MLSSGRDGFRRVKSPVSTFQLANSTCDLLTFLALIYAVANGEVAVLVAFCCM